MTGELDRPGVTDANEADQRPRGVPSLAGLVGENTPSFQEGGSLCLYGTLDQYFEGGADRASARRRFDRDACQIDGLSTDWMIGKRGREVHL